MKLIELNPRWVGIHNFDSNSVYYIGISFDSPISGRRLAVLFEPAIDPEQLKVKYGWGTFFIGHKKWQRVGDTFENITLTPSLDFSKDSEWHGNITNGEIK